MSLFLSSIWEMHSILFVHMFIFLPILFCFHDCFILLQVFWVPTIFVWYIVFGFTLFLCFIDLQQGYALLYNMMFSSLNLTCYCVIIELVGLHPPVFQLLSSKIRIFCFFFYRCYFFFPFYNFLFTISFLFIIFPEIASHCVFVVGIKCAIYTG